MNKARHVAPSFEETCLVFCAQNFGIVTPFCPRLALTKSRAWGILLYVKNCLLWGEIPMKTIRKICKIEYALMAYNLVLLLYLLAAIPIEVIVTGKYALLVFLGSVGVSVLAAVACHRAKVRLSRIHLLALAFYGWMLVAIGYHWGDIAIRADNIPHMMLFFCFTLPVFLSFLSYTHGQFFTQWKVIAVGYNLAVSVLCVLGIWCTLTDLYISFPSVGYNYIGFVDLKLYILTHYNSVGHYIALAMVLCMFMLVYARKVWVKALYAIDFALLFVTLGLTYSRTVELTMAACAGIAVCYYIWHAPKLQAAATGFKNILLRLAVCGVAFLAIVAAGYAGMVQVNNSAQAYILSYRTENSSGQKKVEGFASALNLSSNASQHATQAASVSFISFSTASTSHGDGSANVATSGVQTTTSLAISAGEASAYLAIEAMPGIADSAAQGMTQEEYIAYLQEARSLSDLSTMAARLYYWEAALGYFITDIECQIWGTSPAGVVLMLDEVLLDANPPHTHNVFVQIIVALGWVGIALFLALWGTCLFYAAKCFFTKQHGFVGDCMPLLILLAFTAIGFQENMMFSTETSLMLPAFFMACASVAHLAQQTHPNA